LRFTYLIVRAELDGIVCSGARRGKQFTYALLDERAPQTRTLERDAALAELAKRYFVSHGPATLKDFVWWSGLTMADANKGLDSIRSQLISEVENGQTYWFADSTPDERPSPTVHLLPIMMNILSAIQTAARYLTVPIRINWTRAAANLLNIYLFSMLSLQARGSEHLRKARSSLNWCASEISRKPRNKPSLMQQSATENFSVCLSGLYNRIFVCELEIIFNIGDPP
jgi:hypothetical protein